MKKWNINIKPSKDECPRRYCFCWTPPGGDADLSGREYDSFEKAVTSNSRVTFLHGGCASPLGRCKRETKDINDSDHYEPSNRILKKHELPELFFCDPEYLNAEDQEEYQEMANTIWPTSSK